MPPPPSLGPKDPTRRNISHEGSSFLVGRAVNRSLVGLYIHPSPDLLHNQQRNQNAGVPELHAAHTPLCENVVCDGAAAGGDFALPGARLHQPVRCPLLYIFWSVLVWVLLGVKIMKVHPLVARIISSSPAGLLGKYQGHDTDRYSLGGVQGRVACFNPSRQLRFWNIASVCGPFTRILRELSVPCTRSTCASHILTQIGAYGAGFLSSANACLA